MRVNPVPRGLMTRRQGGTMRSRMAPLVRVPRTPPRILSAEKAGRPVGALRTHRDQAMVLGTLLAGLRRREVLGLRFAHVQVADRRLVVVEGKGGHHRVVPVANRFFEALGAYPVAQRRDPRLRGGQGSPGRRELRIPGLDDLAQPGVGGAQREQGRRVFLPAGSGGRSGTSHHDQGSWTAIKPTRWADYREDHYVPGCSPHATASQRRG